MLLGENIKQTLCISIQDYWLKTGRLSANFSTRKSQEKNIYINLIEFQSLLKKELHIRTRIPDFDHRGMPRRRKCVEAVDEQAQAQSKPRPPLRSILIYQK